MSHPFLAPDKPPTDPEIWEVVAKLQNGHVVGVTGMKTEHLKEWFRGIRCEEAGESLEGQGIAGGCLYRWYRQLGKAAPC
jgi:hypothetical protein